MSASKRLRFPGILLSIVVLVALSVVGMSGVSAKGRPLTKEHSFAVFYNKTPREAETLRLARVMGAPMVFSSTGARASVSTATGICPSKWCGPTTAGWRRPLGS